jgi:hypothetical protein
MRQTPKVERVLRAYILLDETRRRDTDPRVVGLQRKMHAVWAQLTPDEAWALSVLVTRYRETRR